MNKTIDILYPSGAHGNFLSVVLNTMLGNQMSNSVGVSYDDREFKYPPAFSAHHHVYEVTPPVINIRVEDRSMLKYCAICLNRTSVLGKSLDIVIEDLNLKTFDKFQQHPIFKNFIPSLMQLSELKFQDNVPFEYLREWARLCLFDNNYSTVKQWMQTCQLDNPEYVFDFEYFYDGQLKEHCLALLEFFNLDPVTDDIEFLIKNFEKNNRYRLIDHQADSIIQNILEQSNIEIKPYNFLLEAWVDNWLKKTFDVEPLFQNSYFKDTQSLISCYNLDKKGLL